MVQNNKETIYSFLNKEKDLKKIFKFLDENEIEELCSYLELKEWPPDTIIMKEGEPGEFMGFLVKGKLAVNKETSFSGKHILIAILESGTMVGEISAVERGLRTGTVVTLEESILLILSGDNMEELIKKNPVLGIKLLRRIIHVLTIRLRQAGDRLTWVL